MSDIFIIIVLKFATIVPASKVVVAVIPVARLEPNPASHVSTEAEAEASSNHSLQPQNGRPAAA